MEDATQRPQPDDTDDEAILAEEGHNQPSPRTVFLQPLRPGSLPRFRDFGFVECSDEDKPDIVIEEARPSAERRRTRPPIDE